MHIFEHYIPYFEDRRALQGKMGVNFEFTKSKILERIKLRITAVKIQVEFFLVVMPCSVVV